MATIFKQRDLVVKLKKETFLNVDILCKIHPMPLDLQRYVFKEKALEKPTQNFFNYLSYYLVSIIDSHISASLPWPLYDSKTERTYRNELASFITDCSNKGLLTPIMSSYLVNPGCYKVTMLIFQLSQLAVQRTLLSKMNKDYQRKLYNSVSDRYNLHIKEGFIEVIDDNIQYMLRKFSNYMNKRQTMERIAELFCNRILQMERKLHSLNVQNYINNLVDIFINKYDPNKEVKQDVLKIKNINEPSQFFASWLQETDIVIDKIESDWKILTNPLLKLSSFAYENSKELIARHTGELDKSSFTLEYYHHTDALNTKDLQSQVNSEQNYILKNIEKDGRLQFPNLVRSFVIAISFILKNIEDGDDINKLNEYLSRGLQSFSELVLAMKIVNNRVLTAESKLKVAPMTLNHSLSSNEFILIPPMPDLSDLIAYKNGQFLFDNFTPLGVSKHQFNLRRMVNTNFIKPQSFTFTAPKDDFLKSLISCRISTYDKPNTTQSINNMSIISNTNRVNETIAECSTGFTRQQISRLLSTKKSSSSKKFKYKTERPEIKIAVRGLFNESINSNDSSGLFRSYSSPDLFENRKRQPLTKGKARKLSRKLSIMQEDEQNSFLEVSGIAALDKNSNSSSPQSVHCLGKQQINMSNLLITCATNESVHNALIDQNKEIVNGSIYFKALQSDSNRIESQEAETKTETPKSNIHLIKKTSSLEKIINKYKTLKAKRLHLESYEPQKIIKTISEEKENQANNFNTNKNIFNANRILLPDLLNTNANNLTGKTEKCNDFCLDMGTEGKGNNNDSFGAALGVDHTFLDQFDVID